MTRSMKFAAIIVAAGLAGGVSVPAQAAPASDETAAATRGEMRAERRAERRTQREVRVAETERRGLFRGRRGERRGLFGMRGERGGLFGGRGMRGNQVAMQRCAADYRSFDPGTGTYTTFGGETVRCPYLR